MTLNGKMYTILKCIGRGGSSKVRISCKNPKVVDELFPFSIGQNVNYLVTIMILLLTDLSFPINVEFGHKACTVDLNFQFS